MRHTMLVNSAIFHQVRELQRYQTAKVPLKVIQGHWQWLYSTGHIQFPVSLPLQLRLYLAPLMTHYQLFTNI